MSATIPMEEAQATLKELISKLAPGEEVVITENQEPVARLIATLGPPRKPRQPGTLRGTALYMAPDFNSPLADFKEYMP